jgi:hypothetical protein
MVCSVSIVEDTIRSVRTSVPGEYRGDTPRDVLGRSSTLCIAQRRELTVVTRPRPSEYYIVNSSRIKSATAGQTIGNPGVFSLRKIQSLEK